MGIPASAQMALDEYEEMTIRPARPIHASDAIGTQHQIDEEIYALLERVRGLQRHRNELSPISKLPPELLVKIFNMAQPSLNNARTYVAFSQVSSQWRNVALDTPTLWCHINIDGKRWDWTRTLLDRSQDEPLTVFGSSQPSPLPQDITNILLSRDIRVVHVDCTTASGPGQLLRRLSLSTLADLHVTGTSGPASNSIPRETLTVAKNLRHLECDRVIFDWDAPYLTSLVCLVIGEVPSQSTLPTNRFIDVLSKIPSLEYLEMSTTILNDTSTTKPSRSAALYLRRLRTLKVVSTLDAILPFLECIDLAPQVSLDLELYSTTDAAVKWRTLLSLITSGGLIFSPSCEAIHLGAANDKFHFKLWGEYLYADFPTQSNVKPAISIVLMCAEAKLIHSEILPAVISSFKFDEVRMLEVGGFQLTADTWCRLFGKNMKLQCMSFQGDVENSPQRAVKPTLDNIEFLKALGLAWKVPANPEVEGSQPSVVVSFPNLWQIRLQALDFKNFVVVDALINAMAKRASEKLRSPVVELIISGCHNVTDNFVCSASNYVDKVTIYG